MADTRGITSIFLNENFIVPLVEASHSGRENSISRSISQPNLGRIIIFFLDEER